MPINEEAAQRLFRGIRCAYTGRPVSVRVVALDGKEPMFFSPDAFDPSIPVSSLKELLLKAGTRDGVMGALADEKALVCAYTGSPMSIGKTPEGLFFLRGGFRPGCPVRGAAEFNYRMRMRGGVSEVDKPGEPARVSMSVSEPAPRAESEKIVDRDIALAYAEEALKDAPGLPRRTVVSVPGGKPAAAAQKRKPSNAVKV